MPYEVGLRPGGLELVWSGPVSVDDMAAAARDLAAIDPTLESPTLLVDLIHASVDGIDIDAIRGIVSGWRSGYPRDRKARGAIVAQGPAAGFVIDYIRMRDALTAGRAGGTPSLALFATRDDARAWLEHRDDTLPRWSVAHDGLGLFLDWDGPFDLDELLAAASALGELDPDQKAPYAVQDLRRMTTTEVDVPTLHRLASGVGTRFARPQGFRSAVVATGLVAETFQHYVDVRDLTSGRPTARRPELRVFADLAAARAWAMDTGGRSSP